MQRALVALTEVGTRQADPLALDDEALHALLLAGPVSQTTASRFST